MTHIPLKKQVKMLTEGLEEELEALMLPGSIKHGNCGWLKATDEATTSHKANEASKNRHSAQVILDPYSIDEQMGTPHYTALLWRTLVTRYMCRKGIYERKGINEIKPKTD